MSATVVVSRATLVNSRTRRLFLLAAALATPATSSTGAAGEWNGAAETGKEYAVGDPPPRAPRLPANATCAFGRRAGLVAAPCMAAHNYFHDFEPVVDVSGEIVQVEGDACSQSSLQFSSTSTLSDARSDASAVGVPVGSVVAVRRGGCSFADKVVNILAAAPGAAAVVIVDHEGSELTAPGLGDTKGVGVPVVMVPFAVGRRLFPAVFRGVVVALAPPARASVVLVSATLDELRGRGKCQCSVEAPDAMDEFHVFHREGLKERLDFVVDEGKRALMCFSPPRTIKAMRHFAPLVPPFASVGVSQALLDVFVAEVLPRFKHPIVLVTSDYNSDRSAPKPFAIDHVHLLDDPRVAHWFSDNWNTPPAPAADYPDERQPWCVSDGFSNREFNVGERLLRLHRFSDDPTDATLNYPSHAISSCSAHPKLTVAPIGINDRHVQGSHGDRRLLLATAKVLPPCHQRPPVARANFHFSQKLGWWDNPASGHCCDRAEAFRALAPQGLQASLLALNGTFTACVDDSGAIGTSDQMAGTAPLRPCSSPGGERGESVHFVATSQTVAEAWAGLAGFAFEVSPEGNGVDCHRTWEALVLNTIPIVRSSSRDALFAGLPVLIVDEWAELAGAGAAARLVAWHKALAPLFEGASGKELRRRLTVEHWTAKVVVIQAKLRKIADESTFHTNALRTNV